MAGTKEIQHRIKSIRSTKKITRAMEMVSAAKMKKAVDAVLRTRTYANLSWETVINLARSTNGEGKISHPLLMPRKKVKNVVIVLITSNRGLCGGFNSNIISKAVRSIEKYHRSGKKAEIEANFVLIGKKGAAIRRQGHKIAADFPKLDLATEVNEITPIAKMVIEDYLKGVYDKVMVAYTDFASASRQIPRVKQLLPVEIDTEDEFLGIVGKDGRIGVSKELMENKKKKHLSYDKFFYEYIFEPSPREVLDEMVPRLIEIQLYQALLESNASEHSVRMAAMHQATEAAGEMIDELNLFYNKARQAVITKEIAEISAGANALSGN